MKVEIDLDELLAAAVVHMESEEDLRWSVGAALQDLYWDWWVEPFHQRMVEKYKEETK